MAPEVAVRFLAAANPGWEHTETGKYTLAGAFELSPMSLR